MTDTLTTLYIGDKQWTLKQPVIHIPVFDQTEIVLSSLQQSFVKKNVKETISQTGGMGTSSITKEEAALIVLGLRHKISSSGTFLCPSSSVHTGQPPQKRRKLQCELCMQSNSQNSLPQIAKDACDLTDSPGKTFFCAIFNHCYGEDYHVILTTAPSTLHTLPVNIVTRHSCAALLQKGNRTVLLYGTADIVFRRRDGNIQCVVEIGNSRRECVACTKTYRKLTLTGKLACNMLGNIYNNMYFSSRRNVIYGIAVHHNKDKIMCLHIYKGRVTLRGGIFSLALLESFELREGDDLIDFLVYLKTCCSNNCL